MIIAVDFDGTCVEHKYPDIGLNVPGAVTALKELATSGHKLILYTMRSGEELDAACKWFFENEIPLWCANANPMQSEWTLSPKVYAHKYIDDAAIGCPLRPGIQGTRPMVDWTLVMDHFDGA